MHFFRSEEHLRHWEGFQETKRGGIIALGDLMRLFSGPYFTKRREPDYFSHIGEYMADMLAELGKLKNAGSYWRLRWFEKLAFSVALKFRLI